MHRIQSFSTVLAFWAVILLAGSQNVMGDITCSGVNGIEFCCPGYSMDIFVVNGELKSGKCCIPSSNSRRAIDIDKRNIQGAAVGKHKREVSCLPGDISIPLTAADYSERVSSAMATNTPEATNEPSPTTARTTTITSSARASGLEGCGRLYGFLIWGLMLVGIV